MASPQTLDDADRRLVALWAADCAERVLPLGSRPRELLGRPRPSLTWEARIKATTRRLTMAPAMSVLVAASVTNRPLSAKGAKVRRREQVGRIWSSAHTLDRVLELGQPV